MWAGGALEFHAPLRAGLPATKTTHLVKSEHKVGRTGPLGFVKLQHDIEQDGVLCVREIQDLVYREDPDPSAPTPKRAEAPTDETKALPVSFNSTQLFRYSALTFNGHRIHYDEDYARSVEGYGGLVTHGPLLAQLLMLLAERELGKLKTFSFRGAAPLFHHEKAALCWKDGDLWVRAEDGGLIMTGTAT
jgi:3-methylfumaryl-CoA hydratase